MVSNADVDLSFWFYMLHKPQSGFDIGQHDNGLNMLMA
jgi:hypothetical protein